MDKTQKQIGQILIKRGFINAEQLKEVLDEQQGTKEFLGEILIRKKQITEKNLIEAMSEQFNIPVVSLKDKYLDWKFIGKFSPSLILDHKCFPVTQDEWTITVAVTNPLNAQALRMAEEETSGFKLKLALATAEDMKEAVKRYQRHVRGKYI